MFGPLSSIGQQTLGSQTQVGLQELPHSPPVFNRCAGVALGSAAHPVEPSRSARKRPSNRVTSVVVGDVSDRVAKAVPLKSRDYPVSHER